MLGKVEGRRRKGKQKIRWLDSIIDSLNMSLSNPWKTMKDREAWCAVVHGLTKIQIQLRELATEQQQIKLKKKTNGEQSSKSLEQIKQN